MAISLASSISLAIAACNIFSSSSSSGVHQASLALRIVISQALYLDHRDRGGLDIQAAFQDGNFRFQHNGQSWEFVPDPRLQGTWQLSTAMLYVSMMSKFL